MNERFCINLRGKLIKEGKVYQHFMRKNYDFYFRANEHIVTLSIPQELRAVNYHLIKSLKLGKKYDLSFI